MGDVSNLVFLPLGGAGEIGMNMYLYGHGPVKKRRWIIVDCGVSFGDMNSAPGVELVMPDVSFLKEIKDRIDGVFITHAHEDHVGAIGRLWPFIEAPFIAAPAFTAAITKRKLQECGYSPKIVKTAKWDKPVSAGPFEVSYLPVTHSIPDPAMLLIETPAGRIVHTGDFKLDPDPVIGKPTNMKRLKEIGEAGVLALMCDSTNIFDEGEAGGEQSVTPALKRLISEAKGAVAATTFASNVARLKTLAEAAVESGRSVVVAGRAMQRMIEAAKETGAIDGFPPTVPDTDARDIPAANIMYLITGSQGEGRAALARIASHSHPTVKLKSGDTVLFSSKTIPGNEKEVYRIYNLLSEQGISVIDSDMEKIHVSGHGKRNEISRLYDVLRPKISVPMHGEHRHLSEHAIQARGWGAASVVAANGAIVALDGNGPEIVDHAETGRLYLDGDVLIGALDGVIRQRLKMARQGHVAVSLVIDEDGELFADPQVEVSGGPRAGKGGEDIGELISARIDEAISNASAKELRSDDKVADLARRVARRAASEVWGKKPETAVLVTRLDAD